MTFLKEGHSQKTQDTQEYSFSIIDFLIKVNIDKFDVFKLEEFIQKSEISKKITLFSNKQADQVNKKDAQDPKGSQKELPESGSLLKDISLLDRIMTFITSLIKSNTKFSRLIISLQPKLLESSLKIVDIEPSRNLTNLMNNSLCFVFAGGTLEPVRY